jgi:hypothetical protein
MRSKMAAVQFYFTDQRYSQIRARQAGVKRGKGRSLQPLLLELAASGVAMEIRVVKKTT